MTLPGQFGELQHIEMVADANTPAEYQVLHGRLASLRPADLSTMGSGPDNPGELMGIHGYPMPGGPTGTQFLMTPLIPQAIVDAFNVIPGDNGWVNPAARDVYSSLAVALINDFDIAPGTVLSGVTSFYNAAVDEGVERVAQGFPPRR